ncbi:hypothetical protein GpartN1_g3569.t1 [Galdieria partita]|uniref:Sulfite exporter TauE/SafE family protein n=1 Tax=Galdieria partita TaxID=83374 RepID=A0A9C7PVY5_9RHOD|nr:hypothetical protein GpartN1_g3569.t1 [Galdieria partita]
MFASWLRRKNDSKSLILTVLLVMFFLELANATYNQRNSEHSLFLYNIPSPHLQDSWRELDLDTLISEKTWSLSLNESVHRSSSASNHGQLGAYCTSISHCVYGLVCVNQTCSYCTTSSQCQSIQLICDSSSHQCTHKPLTDFTWRDGLTFVLVFIIAGLSNAGGVGGGFLFVPVLVLATGYRASTAAAISQALVTGASGANTFYGLIRRHPKRERPRIDYGVVIHFIPSVLCGTSIGVLLNELFPNFFTLFALSALVLYVFYVSLKKGISLWKQERKEASDAKKESQTCQGNQNNLESTQNDRQCNGAEELGTSDAERGSLQEDAVEPQSNTNISLEIMNNGSRHLEVDEDNSQISSAARGHHANGDIAVNSSETDDDEDHKSLSKNCGDNKEILKAQKEFEGSMKPDIIIPVDTGNDETLKNTWKHRFLASWSKLEQSVLSVLDRVPLLGKFIDPGRYLKSSEDIIQHEKKQYPIDSIIFVVIIFIFLVVFSLLRGGHSPHSLAGVPLCSAGYAVLYVVQEIGLVLFTLFAGIRNVRMQTLKERVGYPFYAKDFHWTKHRVIYFSPLMIILGAIGAWVGAGGSFMSTPILVAGIGMDPVVVQSTAGFMNFTSGFSSALQYIFDHQMKIDYGLSLGATTLVGSFTGLYILNGLVARYNLQAILVIVMSIVMFGAFAVDLYAGVEELIGVLDLNEHFPIHSICAAS